VKETTPLTSTLLDFGLRSVENSNLINLTVSIEFASRSKASRRYPKMLSSVVTGEEMYGGLDMFDSWPVFIADDNLFINDVLSLKVEVTLVG
jgi:hypothetical protein